MNQNTKNFLKFAKKELKQHGFKLKIHHSKRVRVDKNIYTSGLFSEIDKQIDVAIKKEEHLWLGVLVHEFCHFLQYLENNKYWQVCHKSRVDHFHKFDDWLNGKSIKNIETVIDEIKMLEYDCERKAVALIKKCKLKINVENYTQRANSYIAFYDHIKKSRKWYGNLAPYENKQIYKKMPVRIQARFSKQLLSLY